MMHTLGSEDYFRIADDPPRRGRYAGKVKGLPALHKYLPKKILNVSISLPAVRRIDRSGL
jgi:hypothetical protein